MDAHFCLRSVLLLAAISFLGGGCGGAAASAGEAEASSPGAAAEAKATEDPKVAEARTRCEQEIQKAELQPPDRLAAVQVHACIWAKRPAFASCSKGVKKEIVIKIVVEKTGVVSNAFPVGDTADCPEAKCVAEAVKQVVFPKFKGILQDIIKYPFTVGE